MNKAKKLLGVLLAVTMLVGISVTALAETYFTEDGDITVSGTAQGQSVTQSGNTTAQQSETIITNRDPGTNSGSGVKIDSTNGAVSVTIQDVNASYMQVDHNKAGQGATVNVQGSNNFEGANNAVNIAPTTAETVTFEGDGVVAAAGNYSGVSIGENATVNVNGATIIGTGSSVNGVTVSGTLNVNEGTVVGVTNSANPNRAGLRVTGTGTVTAGEGVTVMGEDQDITEAFNGDYTVLNQYKTASISVPAPAAEEAPAVQSDRALAILGEDGRVEAVILATYYGTAVEKTGEPDEAAMKTLSEGIEGECVYSASFAFADSLEKHGKLQIDFNLPEYAGQKVIVSTIVDGAQVTYERWVSDKGIATVTVDHLGDFAVFLA